MVVDLPPSCDYAKWLIETAQGIGFGTSENPTSYSDIKAWQEFSGINLTPFEAETIREICISYLSGSRNFRESDTPPPFITDEYRMRRARAAEESFMSA